VFCGYEANDGVSNVRVGRSELRYWVSESYMGHPPDHHELLVEVSVCVCVVCVWGVRDTSERISFF
jgi:hypothetical protein